MSFHLIRIIAAYEMRTLLRSWFFRIFAGGVIFGLCIFNITMNVEATNAPWIFKALAASMPYANLIVLNLGQAVVAVFLASEFLKQDRKNDTVDVIYARSMSNGQYILGKTLGILAVFLVLNIIVLLMGIGFSFLSSAHSQSILVYFAYPLLISLPTLVFILGLAFFTMVIVKNQAVTFVLLIGYIALTVFYLDKKVYHLFDYIAYQVPMMYSSISGFGNVGEILLHRSIYLVLGIGLILFTIYKLPRLPQSSGNIRLPLFLGLFFFLAGALMVFQYLNNKKSLHTFRQQAISLNNKYAGYPTAMVDSCRLETEHLGDQIKVNASLVLINRNKHPLDTLIFSLNPGLRLENMILDRHPVEFKRNSQIIMAFLADPLQAGDSLEISMRYSGFIDEKIAFLDQDNEKFDANPSLMMFRLYKRYAFLKKNYVCLTAESLWYPITGTGYAPAVPLRYHPDFTHYSLKVKTTPGLIPISQGRMEEIEKGIVEFKPEYALPQLTLLIGDYVKQTISVDAVEYTLYAIKGHDYFKQYFDQVADTLPTLIRDLKKEYEVSLGLKYPFQRLILAEVPVHFCLDQHVYSYTSDAIQPEIILCPEKGVLFNSSDFRSRKYRLEKNRKNNNEEVLPEVIQADLFTQFVRRNFMNRWDENNDLSELVNWQTYHISPEYLTFFAQLRSEKWPVMSIAMNIYFNRRNFDEGTSLHYYEDLSTDEKINLELSGSSLKQVISSSADADKNSKYLVSIRELVQKKGLYFFDLLKTRHGEAFDTLLTRIVLEHPHQTIPFEKLNKRFMDQLKVDLEKEVLVWYEQNKIPGFIVKNISSYKVMDHEISKYQIRFHLSNPEQVDGFVTLNVELNDPNKNQGDPNMSYFNADFHRKIFVPAKTSWDVGFVFNTEPARMSVMTHISYNLPNALVYGFSGFHETRNIPLLDEVIPISFFDRTSQDKEIITDNEDADFSFKQTTNQAYLKSLINHKKEDRYKYAAIQAYHPPQIWQAALRSEFYGHYIHSAHYTKGGSGERKALWKAAIPEKGSYDVYFYVDKVHLNWRRSNKSPDYNISIYHDNGVEKINQVTEELDNGWNYLGTWYISSDTAKVGLSNKSSGDMVFADAVKWVLNE